MTEQIDPQDVRVGDAEREHAGELLQRAVGQGRLSLPEFDERMAAAMVARTRGELDAIVADVADHPATRPAGAVAKKSIELRAEMGNIVRRGYWVVPETIHVRSEMGNVVLDFTSAELSATTTTIEAKIDGGNLRLVVPPGAIVDADDVRLEMGSIKNRTVRGPHDAGPHIVVRGRLAMGNVIVQHKKAWRFGLFTIHSPFRVTWGPGGD